MEKKKFQDFLDRMNMFQDSLSEASLYVATYFGLKKYIAIFAEYEEKEDSGEDVDDEEVYKIYLKMLNYLKWRYPFRYRKMDKYIEQNL